MKGVLGHEMEIQGFPSLENRAVSAPKVYRTRKERMWRPERKGGRREVGGRERAKIPESSAEQGESQISTMLNYFMQ